MKKNRLFLLLSLALVVMLIGASIAFAAPVRIRISVCNSLTHPQTIGLSLFKEYVEE